MARVASREVAQPIDQVERLLRLGIKHQGLVVEPRDEIGPLASDRLQHLEIEVPEVPQVQRTRFDRLGLQRRTLVALPPFFDLKRLETSPEQIEADLELQGRPARLLGGTPASAVAGLEFRGQADGGAVLHAHLREPVQQGGGHGIIGTDDVADLAEQQLPEELDGPGCEPLIDGLRRDRRVDLSGGLSQFVQGDVRIGEEP